MKTQDIKLELTIRCEANGNQGVNEYRIIDSRAEAITQVEPDTAVIAYGAKAIAEQAVNQFLKQHNERIYAQHLLETGALL